MTAPRYVLEDPTLPHQIIIALQCPGNLLVVSCNCRRTGKRRAPRAIEARTKWEPGDAYACWLGHMAEIGEVA
jgi:hypothetical protein